MPHWIQCGISICRKSPSFSDLFRQTDKTDILKWDTGLISVCQKKSPKKALCFTARQFGPFDRLQATGHTVDRVNYELIYTAPLTKDLPLVNVRREDVFLLNLLLLSA